MLVAAAARTPCSPSPWRATSKAHNAIIKELELDRVKSTVTHIDLQEIRLDETIETTVAVSFEGEAIGLKSGGMLDESTREVTIKGLVTAIPEHLVLDISEMDINDTAKVGDLVVPEGIEVLNDPDEVLCSLLPPRKVEEELEEGAEAAESRRGRRRARDRGQGRGRGVRGLTAAQLRAA